MAPELRNGQVRSLNTNVDKPSEIERFFHGRNILVTGGTGFMGKVLLEKLLHANAGIGNIYVPIRTKREEDPQKRLNRILQSQMFHRVRPLLWKIVGVPANLCELGLALSPEWRRRLCEEVSIVFHAAATTRFNACFPYAVLLNTRGTRETLQLAKDMPNIVAFVHVSTMYCNTDHNPIEEVLYPEHADWRAMVRIAEKGDKDTLCALTHKLIGGCRSQPNTYTFTKSLAEHVVKDYAHLVPCVIFRPSIVISADREPLPGWADNFNGPAGIFTAAGKGILHATYLDSSLAFDLLPVDVAIKAMVAAAWKKGTERDSKKSELVVYNAATTPVKPVTMKEAIAMTDQFYEDIPFNNVVWLPTKFSTSNYALYYIAFVLMQLIPAIIADIFLKTFGHKLSLLRIQRKIFKSIEALSYFMTNSWQFENKNFLELDSCIQGKDRQSISFKFTDVDVYTYFYNSCLGSRRYLLKEKDTDLPSARAHYRRLKVIHFIVTTLLKTMLFYIILNSSWVRRFFNCFNGIVRISTGME